MRTIRQLFIILLFSLLGELLRYCIPLNIPASIYGMASLLLALKTGIIKLESVKGAGDALIEILPLLFICPAAAGIVDNGANLLPVFAPAIVIIVVTTVVVMGVSGKITQYMLGERVQK